MNDIIDESEISKQDKKIIFCYFIGKDNSEQTQTQKEEPEIFFSFPSSNRNTKLHQRYA